MLASTRLAFHLLNVFVREAGAVRTFTPRYCACRAPAGRWGWSHARDRL